MKKEKTVDINVRNIPEDLMAKFDIYVVKPSYPGGRSEAIRNLIHAEVLKRQGKDKFVKKTLGGRGPENIGCDLFLWYRALRKSLRGTCRALSKFSKLSNGSRACTP